MKLTELDTQTTTRLRRALPPEAEVLPDVEVDTIRVARLPQEDGAGVGEALPEADTALETAPHPSRPVSGQPAALAQPPALMFVTGEARRSHINSRAALLLMVVVMAAGFVWVVGSSTTGSSRGSHQAPVRLTPAEQRIAEAARARAAAIAQLKRDRGTDAQWEDTIPAPAPPTPAATP